MVLLKYWWSQTEPLGDLDFNIHQLEVLPANHLQHHTDCQKSAFFLVPFFFVILHNWRVWIIYNSQIIFWIVSASGRQKGNFNDVPGSAKASFTVSEPFKFSVEYHPPRCCTQTGIAARCMCLCEATEFTKIKLWSCVCFSIDSSICIKIIRTCQCQHWLK